MITKIPFDWNNTSHTSVIEKYKVTGHSGYEGYYPCDFQFYGKNITTTLNGGTYKLEVSPAGNEPMFWISGILENYENPYSAYVKSTVNNPQYKF